MNEQEENQARLATRGYFGYLPTKPAPLFLGLDYDWHSENKGLEKYARAVIGIDEITPDQGVPAVAMLQAVGDALGVEPFWNIRPNLSEQTPEGITL